MVTDWVLDVVYVISPLHLPAIDGASDCDGCDGCVGVDPDVVDVDAPLHPHVTVEIANANTRTSRFVCRSRSR